LQIVVEGSVFQDVPRGDEVGAGNALLDQPGNRDPAVVGVAIVKGDVYG